MGRQASERRPRRAPRLFLVGTLLLAAGCFAAPPPPPSAPPFPGYPGIPPYSGNQCKTVLLVGDSLMTPVGNLEGVNWSTRLQGLIAQHHPDIVVIQFVGNGFDGTNDAAWLAQQQAGITDLVN